jgi:hypothetical protein
VALNKVTLTGTYQDGTGAPLAGYLKFVPNTQLTDATDSEIVRQSPITATLSTEGAFSVELYATDNSDLLPSGWVWNCTEYITGIAPAAYSFSLAYATASTQDISTLETITDAPETSTYVPTANIGQPSGVAGLNSSGHVPVTQGGTGAGTASAAFNALSPNTTLGDITYGSGANASARLAGNTTAQVKVFTQTGNGTVSAAPAWGVVSGQYLCTPTQYAPGAQASLTTTSATFAAVSSANVNTGSFAAPPSGSVVVTAAFSAQVSAADAVAFGLAAHGTVTPMVGKTPAFSLPATGVNLPQSLEFIVTGLTAGTSYNLDLMFAIASAGTLTVNAIGQSGTSPGFGSTSQGLPVAMTVQAI